MTTQSNGAAKNYPCSICNALCGIDIGAVVVEIVNVAVFIFSHR
jgi:hypothetical protein